MKRCKLRVSKVKMTFVCWFIGLRLRELFMLTGRGHLKALEVTEKLRGKI